MQSPGRACVGVDMIAYRMIVIFLLPVCSFVKYSHSWNLHSSLDSVDNLRLASTSPPQGTKAATKQPSLRSSSISSFRFWSCSSTTSYICLCSPSSSSFSTFSCSPRFVGKRKHKCFCGDSFVHYLFVL